MALPFVTQVERENYANLWIYNFFISDLHLQESTAELNQQFAAFIQQLLTLAQNNKRENTKRHLRLYILGDFLALGIGDFIPDWFKPYQESLQTLAQAGVEIFFMVGNRDFLLGKKFSQGIGATFLPENTIVDFSTNATGAQAYYQYLSPSLTSIVSNEQTYSKREQLCAEFKHRLQEHAPLAKTEDSLRLWLCHGDNLCLSDEAYQKYRRFIRSGLMQGVEKLIPTWLVKKIAQRISAASQRKRQEHEERQTQITATWGELSSLDMADIDLNYTHFLAQLSQANLLVYGHVHRQRILSWNLADPQVQAYASGEQKIAFGNLNQVNTPSIYTEVDDLYPIPVGKIRTFTAGIKQEPDASEQAWAKLDALSQNLLPLTRQDFYTASMADWLSEADLAHQEQLQAQAVKSWQQQAQEQVRQKVAWTQTKQSPTSIGLLVQQAYSQEQIVNTFAFAFISL
ncbi:hypothetical protein CJP74_00300 [Psittacicella melopsittaci]|uniref:Uncharacterized protein n=1 Tax=Psittacicella melopsittaci TaxID=2028576 RepID=A0A3A1Y8R4_9GAMM|nr:metallophosphoesterase [Psittacicella melopsittaci]RIY34055.1 hypothetical protein CJP74_00300 [Psittacicella melopsittaci]